MIKISRDVIDFVIHAAKEVHPKEFIGLLEEDDGVISKVLVVPNSIFGRGFSSIRYQFLSISDHPSGSIHTHPTPNNKPSKQDLNFFNTFGKTHIIISYPYRYEDVAVYDNSGKPQEFIIVD